MRWKLHKPGERGPFYVVRGSHRGRRFEVSTGTTDRGKAQIFAQQYAEGILRDPLWSGYQGPVTFEAAADAWLAFKDPPPYERKRVAALKAWFRGRLVSEITHADLVLAANRLREGRANGTKNREVMGPAVSILHYAAKQEWCAYKRFPLFRVPKKSPRKPATDEMMSALLEAAVGKQRLLLAVLYETGLRIGDALRLDRGSLAEIAEGYLVTPVRKNGEAIRIAVSADLARAISSVPLEADGHVFPWRDRHNVYRWLKPLCRKLGVAYTPHMSRHALATELLRRGIPDKRAAEYGAWLDPRSLHRYQHTQPEPLKGRSYKALTGGKPGGKAKKHRKSAV
jgi:integrase